MAPALQTEIPMLIEFGFYPAADTLVFCSSSSALPTAARCRKDELGLTGGAAFVLGFGSLSQGRGLWPGCECTSQSLDHEAKQSNGFLKLFRVGS